MSFLYREWTCVCGREIMGNGKASHQSACRVYKQSLISQLEGTIERIDAGDHPFPAFRDKFIQEVKDLKKGLARSLEQWPDLLDDPEDRKSPSKDS